jgi:antitoxin component YwqK of YwqJK toxin-antitoxin module
VKNIKTLVFRSIALTAVLVLASFNVYAIDQSICHSGANVILHNNGSLKACQLKNNYDANNIQCKNDGPVSFYDNGNLESCVLYASVTIVGNNCKQDGSISFYIDGKLKSCMKQGN